MSMLFSGVEFRMPDCNLLFSYEVEVDHFLIVCDALIEGTEYNLNNCQRSALGINLGKWGLYRLRNKYTMA